MISFVVPAFNEESALPATLEHLHAAARAAGAAHEVIVVDDDSRDRTAAVATAGGARVLRVAHRQIAATRNAGARLARGEALFFVDADTSITAAALAASLGALRDGAVGGGAVVRFDEPLPAWARVAQAGLVHFAPRLGLAGGCFLWCTRAAFHAVGGFDERLYAAEEIAMAAALRRRGRFVVVREPVMSSGRKLRAYRGREVLVILGRLAVRGMDGVRRRDGLELWYGERRADPARTERGAA